MSEQNRNKEAISVNDEHIVASAEISESDASEILSKFLEVAQQSNFNKGNKASTNKLETSKSNIFFLESIIQSLKMQKEFFENHPEAQKIRFSEQLKPVVKVKQEEAQISTPSKIKTEEEKTSTPSKINTGATKTATPIKTEEGNVIVKEEEALEKEEKKGSKAPEQKKSKEAPGKKKSAKVKREEMESVESDQEQDEKRKKDKRNGDEKESKKKKK